MPNLPNLPNVCTLVPRAYARACVSFLKTFGNVRHVRPTLVFAVSTGAERLQTTFGKTPSTFGVSGLEQLIFLDFNKMLSVSSAFPLAEYRNRRTFKFETFGNITGSEYSHPGCL